MFLELKISGLNCLVVIFTRIECPGVKCDVKNCPRGEMSRGWIVLGWKMLGLLFLHWNVRRIYVLGVCCNGVKHLELMSVGWTVHGVNCSGFDCRRLVCLWVKTFVGWYVWLWNVHRVEFTRKRPWGEVYRD